MRPQRLSLDPNSPSAGKKWKHWIRTFENYLASFPERAKDEIPVNKLHLLTNSVAYDVYDSIEECFTYKSAIRVLENLYVKTSNEIFARHLLTTAPQVSGQSLNDFVQKLQGLGKDCSFRPVTAQVYLEEMVRDTFINGIISSSIRQRLLENRELTLRDAVMQANTLELAQQNSLAYDVLDNLTRHVAAVTEKVQLVSKSQLQDDKSQLASVQPRKSKEKNASFVVLPFMIARIALLEALFVIIVRRKDILQECVKADSEHLPVYLQLFPQTNCVQLS